MSLTTWSMSSLNWKVLVTYSSPRSRKATSPTRIEGDGLPPASRATISFVFVLTLSISFCIEPVVSMQKARSMCGFALLSSAPLACVQAKEEAQISWPTTSVLTKKFFDLFDMVICAPESDTPKIPPSGKNFVGLTP